MDSYGNSVFSSLFRVNLRDGGVLGWKVMIPFVDTWSGVGGGFGIHSLGRAVLMLFLFFPELCFLEILCFTLEIDLKYAIIGPAGNEVRQ